MRTIVIFINHMPRGSAVFYFDELFPLGSTFLVQKTLGNPEQEVGRSDRFLNEVVLDDTSEYCACLWSTYPLDQPYETRDIVPGPRCRMHVDFRL
jgi:hypothetical protein